MRGLTGLFALLALGLAIAHPTAAHAKNKYVRSFVDAAIKEQQALMALHPALVQVDFAIRRDCASKASGRLAESSYCRCAAAVTMQLWRSGMDPNMLPRLSDYLRDPTEAAAEDLLRYQGPELYRPSCDDGTE